MTRSHAQQDEPQPGPSRDFHANEPIRSRSNELSQSQHDAAEAATPPSSQSSFTRPPIQDDLVDPTGFVDIPSDPNLAAGPDRVQSEILSRVFPHLPDPICRSSASDPQPRTHLTDPSDTGGFTEPVNNCPQNQGGAPKTHSFSRPTNGHFSFRRRRPDVNALNQILRSLN